MTQKKSISVRVSDEMLAEIARIQEEDAGPFGKPDVAEVARGLMRRGVECRREHPSPRGPEAKKKDKTR